MRNLIKKILKESEEDFGWANELVQEPLIKVGDVFYVIDRSFGENVHPDEHKPENVRFLFYVNDIYEGADGFGLEYTNCDPEDVSYNPKEYNPTNSRCHYDDGDGYYTDIEYERALELVDKKYWRLMGNNEYYNHLNESETEKSDCVGINLANVTTEQKVTILKKLEEIYGTFVGFYKYPWVDQIQYLVTDFTTPVTVPLKGKRNQCGRWFNDASGIKYDEQNQEYYAVISMDGTKVTWSKEIDGYDFLSMSFIDDTSKLFESEEEFGWVDNLGDEPFHDILMKDKFRKPQLLDEIYTIMFNPPVSVGDDRFNKIAFFLEDNEYYPEVLEPYGKKTSYIKILKRPTSSMERITRFGNNGRYEVGPELNEQELYNLSQTINPKNKWNGNFWEEEFIARFFKKG